VERNNNKQKFTRLRRFGGSSRWFLAELIVIVSGVLIALAIDEWRGNIENVSLEREYLQQLIADLVTTEEKMSVAAETNAVGEDAARQLLDVFESGELPSLATIEQWLSDINKIDTPVPVLGTAEALVSTGYLRLISDSKTRTKLTQYLARSRDYWLFPIYQFENRHRELCFRITMLAEKWGVSPSHRGGQFQRQSDLPSGPDLVAFLADSEAYSHAARLVETKGLLARFRSSMSSEAAELRKTVEHTLSLE
jgi:hypothetical protein